MPAYETDQEQIELIKKWWNDYGKIVLVAIAIGLVAGFGWRYWIKQQNISHQQASLMYQQLLVADSQNTPDTVTQMAGEMQKHYPKTEYANLANLVAAKVAVNQNDLPAALQKLQWVMNHSHLKSLQQIARLRAARILTAQQKMPDALLLLATVDDSTFQPLIDEVKGDIYVAQGDSDKARQSYQAAQVGLSAIVGEDALIAMKLAQPLTKS